MKPTKNLFISILIIFAITFTQFAFPQTAYAACSGIVYVDASSTAPTPDGCSWANAFPTLQDALAIAVSGDQIRVADGTYYPDEGASQTNNDRYSTFALIDGVSLYGGYAGYGAPDPDLRDLDPFTNNTVLSGEIDGNPPDFDNDAFHVMTAMTITSPTEVSGFTIRDGNSRGNVGFGGGIHIESSSNNLQITDMLFTDNTAFSGGGISAFSSDITITRVTFFDNFVLSYGGGLYTQDSSPTLTDVVFDSNRTLDIYNPGGGMHSTVCVTCNTPVAPVLTNVTFSNNESEQGGGGALFNNLSNMVLTNVTFTGNKAQRRGGAILNEGSNPVFNNVTFSGNTVTRLDSPELYGQSMINIDAVYDGIGTVYSNPVIRNTIAWETAGDDIVNNSGSTVTINDSVLHDGSCPSGGTCTNVQFNADPLLGALADNGGFTQTMAIGAGSSALDTGNNGTCAADDQRGVTRPQAETCDIGAYEFDAVPTVTGRTPAPGATSIPLDTNVTATFSEAMNSATITGTTFTLRADGAGSDVPATVSYTGGVATLDPSSNLQGNTLYNVTVAATVADLTGNTLGSADIWSFTTTGPGALTDTTVAHFNAGTLGGCVVDAGFGDGALKLNLPSTTCTFASRIHDAGTLIDWTTLNSTATLPAGTSISFDARTGNTTSPDTSWTNWQAVNGTFTNPGSQYIQYRATLSTTDTGQTPVLEDVTINFALGDISVLNTPTGTLTTWDGAFDWTGVNGATWYLLEVYTPTMTQVHRKWYTSADTNCSVGTACSFTPTDLSLGNGDYQWRVMDYGGYGYGIWAYFKSFTLNAACYTLSTNVSPAGSGTVNVPTHTCAGGYTAGSVVQLTAVPGTGYTFANWSGAATGTNNPVSVTMDGAKSITANMRGNTPLTPVGTLTSWNSSFSWTGLSDATWYLIEVQTSGGTQVFRNWYTSVQTGCSGGTACSVTATGLSLNNGDYKWRVLDYGAYGYGTNSAFKNFTLNAACYPLTTNVNPAGSGTVNAPTQSCAGGYTAGTVVQLTAVPGTGYAFSSWSGAASGTSNPVSVTMDGNKSVTANMRGNTPIAPSGTLTSWNKAFSWTGLSDATWYLIEVQTSTGTQVFRQWYTSSQTGCAGGTACSVTSTGLSLANGDYKWRILDYGAYGYGLNSAFKTFTLNQTLACYTLTTNVTPGGAGTVNAPAQSCAGGYMAGSVIQLTAAPNTGYLFDNWSGAASGTSNPVSLTMDGDKSVTANFKATVVLIAPSGTLGSWSNTFSWTGLTNATWYLLEVYTPGGAQVFRKWYTSPQTGCSGGTACSVVPPETAGLANGDYKWRILDYGAYGYGTWTAYTNFTLNQ